MIYLFRMNSDEIRNRFLNFFEKRGHKILPSASLIPSDPTVLFTTAGMQQFKPYYLGEGDAMRDFGTLNTATVQKCMRTSDIDEVGDESHLTFFEMLGNFSFGGYGKREAIFYAHEFITKELGLEISYVTVFEGWDDIPKDEESKQIWQSLGVQDIREEGILDVFWGPTGDGGPCGPTTEIYCKNVAEHDIEIWNIVFNQFYFPGTREELLSGTSEKELKPLAQMGVDTGMGLERLEMIVQKVPTIFDTSSFKKFAFLSTAGSEKIKRRGRIIADHLRTSAFLIADGVRPSNKEAGYVLRRLIRRSLVQAKILPLSLDSLETILRNIIGEYGEFYNELKNQEKIIIDEFTSEAEKFYSSLEKGLKEFDKICPEISNGFYQVGKVISGEEIFNLHQTYGLTIDIAKDLSKERGCKVDEEGFWTAFKKHQRISRAGAEQKFKGGLADQSEGAIKLHTAHHLLLAALQKILGKEIKQKGSNITSERLRIDFSFDRKLTDEEKDIVEDQVNEWISAGLDVVRKEMKREKAEKIGAEMEFGAKYPEMVSVYLIEDRAGNIISKEFCGGPHVSKTSELGKFKIKKEEAVSAGVRRIKGVLE